MTANQPRVLHVLGVTLVSAAFFVALAVVTGSADHFRFYRPINAGSRYAATQELLPGQVVRHGDGYDGQFYFYIAQDPLLRDPWTAASLDNSIRYRRILYPLLAFSLSLGDRTRLPYALIAINVAALTALVAILGATARRNGVTPWSALIVTLNVGIWLPLLGDLTEPLQCALLAAAFFADSALLIWASGLAKEITLVTMATQTLQHLYHRRLRRAAAYGAALVTTIVWGVLVNHLVQGRESTLFGALLNPPGAPFIQLAETWRQGAVREVLLVPAVATALLGVIRIVWQRDPAALAAAAYLLVALAAGNDTWTDPEAYFRVMVAGVVLMFMSWTGARDRLGGWALGLGAVEGLLVLPALL